MKIIIEDSKNNLSHEYYDVPVKIMKSIKTLLDNYDNIMNATTSLIPKDKKIIIHPWKLGDKEFPYNVVNANIYLDGKLEYMNGYDLCGIENFPFLQSPPDGYECDVLLRGDTLSTIKARLFLWDDNLYDGLWKGLIVAEDDEEAIKSAKEKCRLKLDII